MNEIKQIGLGIGEVEGEAFSELTVPVEFFAKATPFDQR